MAGFLFPQFAFPAAQGTAQNLAVAVRLQRWMAKGLMSLAFFEACILFGLTLHFLHGNLWLVEILFGVGIAAELWWSPGAPPGAEDGTPEQGRASEGVVSEVVLFVSITPLEFSVKMRTSSRPCHWEARSVAVLSTPGG